MEHNSVLTTDGLPKDFPIPMLCFKIKDEMYAATNK